MAAKTQPIIVIKKKGGHGGHHGGAWKVAYADFVTAMMSLFIVLWLMGSSQESRRPLPATSTIPRAWQLLGTTLSGTGESMARPSAADDLQKLKDKLEQEIKARKDLEKLSKQIEITITPEGLRIELIEGKNGTFYEIGSPKLSASGQELLALLASELKTLPNSLLIEGHTDSTPYSTDNSYSNWDLSADRANSARRLMQQDGVRSNQVTQVRGYADMMLRVKNNQLTSNRRISILVKNDGDSVATTLSAAKIVDGNTPLPGSEKQSARQLTKPSLKQASPRLRLARNRLHSTGSTKPEPQRPSRSEHPPAPQAKPSPSTLQPNPACWTGLKA